MGWISLDPQIFRFFILSGVFFLNGVSSSMFSQPGSDSGTTAVVALIRGKQLIVANAGDSRCVVSERGTSTPLASPEALTRKTIV